MKKLLEIGERPRLQPGRSQAQSLGCETLVAGEHGSTVQDVEGHRHGSPVLPRLESGGKTPFRLAFVDSVDLDLYVTGPLLETVYYGNTPSRIGGSLAADMRCDSPTGPRSETITFPDAPAGRYRVGVDFPERCRLATAPVGFRVAVDGDGVRHERSGEIRLGVFEGLVFEFDYVPER